MTDDGYRDEATLREMYLEQEMTTREIGAVFDVASSTISRWLKIHGIPARENWKAGVEAAAEANRVERVKLRTFDAENVDAYEYWPTKVRKDGERVGKAVYVHRLLAVAEYGFDAVAGNDVHHCNHIPWDNRPENVVPVGKSEHGEYHTNQRWGNETSPITASQDSEAGSSQATLGEFVSGETAAIAGGESR